MGNKSKTPGHIPQTDYGENNKLNIICLFGPMPLSTDMLVVASAVRTHTHTHTHAHTSGRIKCNKMRALQVSTQKPTTNCPLREAQRCNNRRRSAAFRRPHFEAKNMQHNTRTIALRENWSDLAANAQGNETCI